MSASHSKQSGEFQSFGHWGEVTRGATVQCVHCLSADTKIVTTDGVKDICRVEVGDRVMDNSGLMTTVTATHCREVDSFYRIKALGGGEAILASDEHPFWTVRAKCKVIGGNKKKHVALGSPEFVAASNIVPKEMWLGIPALSGFTEPTDIAGVTFDSEVARFVGLYLAEGCIGRDRIEFCFHKKEVEYIDFVRRVAKERWGANCCEEDRKNSQALKIMVNSAKLEQCFLRNFGRYAVNKKMPFSYLQYPLNLQKNMMDGLLDGDGHYTPDRCRRILSTISPHLAYQSYIVLRRLGLQPYVESLKAGVRNGVNHQKSYTVTHTVPHNKRQVKRWFELDNMRWVRVTSNEKINAKMTVFNLTTESNTFVANGVATHNCQETWIWSPGSGIKRGWCMKCEGFVCGPKCEKCIHYMQRIENIEAGLPEDHVPIRIFVPPGIDDATGG